MHSPLMQIADTVCGVILQADQLDFAIRQKNKADASERLGDVKTKLDQVLAKVL